MSKASYHNLIREQSGVPFPETEDNTKEAKAFEEEQKFLTLASWQQDPVTQELFKQLSKEVESLETRARELACHYHSNQNHLEIINLLVRSDEQRKILKKYASRNR